MVLVGVAEGDTPDDARWLAAKTVAMRIFPDDEGVMNRSVLETGGDILAVSQFTLMARTKKGNRPSYVDAAKPNISMRLYEEFTLTLSSELGKPVETGVFGADMQVFSQNDGPVTILFDTEK